MDNSFCSCLFVIRKLRKGTIGTINCFSEETKRINYDLVVIDESERKNGWHATWKNEATISFEKKIQPRNENVTFRISRFLRSYEADGDRRDWSTKRSCWSRGESNCSLIMDKRQLRISFDESTSSALRRRSIGGATLEYTR
ncbi:hypothetical protein AB6A40_005513 [Gnathostoma spinigerum]|uniref:Uncharacterized protein n=1 Tax=Gnathostoma spinigerum TaxID=75299 RepID=A0ABD6EKX0_9BILA